MKTKIFHKIFILLLFGITTVLAQYNINKCVLANGGMITQNSSYRIIGTVGQTIIGTCENVDYSCMNGFWYQVNSIITDLEVNLHNSPKEYALNQNYPNPFNPSTKIQYCIPVRVPNMMEGQVVTLKVFDILGREVTTLVNEKQKPGKYEIKFNGEQLVSGVYIYRIQAGNFCQSKKLMIMK